MLVVQPPRSDCTGLGWWLRAGAVGRPGRCSAETGLPSLSCHLLPGVQTRHHLRARLSSGGPCGLTQVWLLPGYFLRGELSSSLEAAGGSLPTAVPCCCGARRLRAVPSAAASQETGSPTWDPCAGHL